MATSPPYSTLVSNPQTNPFECLLITTNVDEPYPSDQLYAACSPSIAPVPLAYLEQPNELIASYFMTMLLQATFISPFGQYGDYNAYGVIIATPPPNPNVLAFQLFEYPRLLSPNSRLQVTFRVWCCAGGSN
jgi:hypothetical protein